MTGLVARSTSLILLGLACAVASSAAVEPSRSCVGARGRARDRAVAACFSIQHGRRERTFRLHVPTERGRSLPVLLVLHGGGGSGSGMEGLTGGGFDRIADREHVLVAYPDGVGRGWNDGRSDLRSEAAREGVDDVGFLTSLVRELARSYPVDPARVYATGISNGGMMSYRLACDAADVFAAVAPVSANLPAELAARCRPRRPIPLLIVEGTEDPIMPWSGGAIRLLGMKRGDVLSTPDTFARFRAWDRCAGEASGPPLDRDPADGTSLVEHVATGCAQGVEVRLDEIRGGGHTWPGGLPYLGPRTVGRVSRELDADEAVWAFLSRFSLPGPAAGSSAAGR